MVKKATPTNKTIKHQALPRTARKPVVTETADPNIFIVTFFDPVTGIPNFHKISKAELAAMKPSGK